MGIIIIIFFLSNVVLNKQKCRWINTHFFWFFFNVKVFFQMNEFKGVSNIDDDGDEYPKKNNSIRKDFCLNVADVFLTGIKWMK